MKSFNMSRRSSRPLRRSMAGGATMALVITLLGALFNSASATHPTVTGKVDCVNGVQVITWTVGGDTAYPNATATIKSQSLATEPTLVGKAVKNTQTVSGTQTGTVAASTTYTQTVKVQFDTHSPGSLVTQTGSVTTGNDCVEEEKVTICHRTGSYSNPYVKITVARSAVDGVAGNSGNMADHYGEHRGPIFYPTIPQGTEWGDIIPPVSGAHSGYNWTAEGQAVYNNGCASPPVVTPPVVNPPVVVPPVVTPPVVTPPTPSPIFVKGNVKKLDKCESNNFFKAVRVKGAHYTVNSKTIREGVYLKAKTRVVKIRLIADGAKYAVTGRDLFVIGFPNNASCSPVVVTPPHTGE